MPVEMSQNIIQAPGTAARAPVQEPKRAGKKEGIPVCTILGVEIAAINMDWLLDYLHKNVRGREGNLLSGDYICVSNVHTTVMSCDDPSYRKIQNDALMAIPDGGPLSTIGRKRGYPDMRRTAGPSLMEQLFMVSAEYGYRHFFYGSTPETLGKLRSVLEATYPGLQIAGMESPPFSPLTQEEDRLAVERINRTRPDFVWVGLGAPKQEIWMSQHREKISGLMIGVGAGFDYFAGNIRRAPDWMQKHNLEWLFRLMQDPKRLLKRYIYTNTKFVWNAVIRNQ